MLARKCNQEEKKLKWYYWLIIAILVILGISTFIPIQISGSPKSFLGYYAFDPYAPISGILLWVIAGAIYWFGKKREKKP